MGSLGSIRIIKRPPPAQVRFKAIQDGIKREVAAVGRLHVQERDKVVSDFDTEIKFGYRVSTTEKQITLSIVVENDSVQVSEGFSVGDLWKSLDKTGTRPHVIRPKKQGGRLAFQAGYQPHTRPVGRYGGPGQATGDTVYTREVQHPGYPPRKFSERINKRLRPAYLKAISRGTSLGWKKTK